MQQQRWRTTLAAAAAAEGKTRRRRAMIATMPNFFDDDDLPSSIDLTRGPRLTFSHSTTHDPQVSLMLGMDASRLTPRIFRISEAVIGLVSELCLSFAIA